MSQLVLRVTSFASKTSRCRIWYQSMSISERDAPSTNMAKVLSINLTFANPANPANPAVMHNLLKVD